MTLSMVRSLVASLLILVSLALGGAIQGALGGRGHGSDEVPQMNLGDTIASTHEMKVILKVKTHQTVDEVKPIIKSTLATPSISEAANPGPPATIGPTPTPIPVPIPIPTPTPIPVPGEDDHEDCNASGGDGSNHNAGHDDDEPECRDIEEPRDD